MADILVTGTRGFIGSAVAANLHMHGFDVRHGVRRPDPAKPAQIACDLDITEQLRAAVRGTRMVVHTAYGDSGAMAQQTGRLLEALSAEGVDHLIHFSSIAVYGDATGDVDETTVACAPLDAYASAKIASEALIRAWADNPSHPARRALLLRPGIVYGRGSTFWIDKLSDRIRQGVWGTFGASGAGRAALVHVDDVAGLVANIAGRLGQHGGAEVPKSVALNVVGPDHVDWNGYFQALAAALGAPALPELPPSILRVRQQLALAAKIWRKLGLPGGAGLALAPTAGEMALFARKAVYRTDVARDMFGFAPGVALAEGLARTFAQAKA